MGQGQLTLRGSKGGLVMVTSVVGQGAGMGRGDYKRLPQNIPWADSFSERLFVPGVCGYVCGVRGRRYIDNSLT